MNTEYLTKQLAKVRQQREELYNAYLRADGAERQLAALIIQMRKDDEKTTPDGTDN